MMHNVKVEDRQGWYRARERVQNALPQDLPANTLVETTDAIMLELYGPCPDPEPPKHRVVLVSAPHERERVYGHVSAGKNRGLGYVDIEVTRAVEVDLDTAESFAIKIIECVNWGREYAS